MKTLQKADTIKYLRIDFSGSDYSTALDSRVKEAFLEDNIDAVIRGQHTPAAGPELWMDFIIGVEAGIAVEVIKYVAHKVGSVVAEYLHHDCCVNSTKVEDIDCDFVIRANSAAGMKYESVDFAKLITEMRQLADSEKASGRPISKIEAPCEIDYAPEGFSVRSVGVGNYSLWLLTYREGERWPNWLYDANNKAFIPLEDSHAIEVALSASDPYYSE